MKASAESSPTQETWLVLFHRLPPRPAYLRVKVRRRLEKIGAILLKNSVYVLPLSDDRLEDFQWLAREIEGDGGEAVICEARFLAGVSEGELRGRLGLPRPARTRTVRAARPGRVAPGRTWVTREAVGIDRIASAWLIRRFIDPKAKFKFVAARGYVPRAGELRFDMYEAEYSHAGEQCTFETLLSRFALSERALAAIGEIVHDIDLKDERFSRRETAGVAALVNGISLATDRDAERLARGAAVFDGLYASLRKQKR